MKKIFLILLVVGLFIFPLNLFADDIAEGEETEETEDDSFPEEKKGSHRMKDRTVEIGLANLDVGFSNDFLTLSQFFQDKVSINIDELEKGLNFRADIWISPLYFQYNNNDKWGFGLSTNVDILGIAGISGKMLTIDEARNEKSDIGGAIFAELGFHGFFSINKFKIKVKPALYFPIMYLKPDISYTYHVADDGTIVDFDYGMRIYTAGSFEGNFSLTTAPGIDLYAGVEFPLASEIGLSEILPFLDFDVGLDMYGLPLIPATMKDYMEISGQIGGDQPFNFFGGDTNWNNFMSGGDTVYGKDNSGKHILRPFKMVAWADWRPIFGFKIFSLKPALGFAVSPLYIQPVSLEAGVTARIDLLNIFIASLGINYFDRQWKNSIDLVLNLRAFELDLGVNFQSPDFAKSFSGGGLGVNFGLKFGW